jgi:hypothetical protein
MIRIPFNPVFSSRSRRRNHRTPVGQTTVIEERELCEWVRAMMICICIFMCNQIYICICIYLSIYKYTYISPVSTRGRWSPRGLRLRRWVWCHRCRKPVRIFKHTFMFIFIFKGTNILVYKYNHYLLSQFPQLQMQP